MSELSFAELSLNRFDDAKTHAERASERSTLPSLKAASLTNLGRVFEARDDATHSDEHADQTAEYYRQSLKLHPGNDEVISHLFQVDESETESLPCTAPAALDAVTDCLNRVFLTDATYPYDLGAKANAKGLQALRVSWVPQNRPSFGDASIFLLATTPAGWRVFFNAGRVRGGGPHYMSVAFGKAVWLSVAGKRLLQLDITRSESVTGGNSIEPDEIAGLDDPIYCSDESAETDRMLFSLSSAGVPGLEDDETIGCSHSRELRDPDQLSLPPGIRHQVMKKLAASRAAQHGDVSVGPDGKFHGMIVDPKTKSSCAGLVKLD